MSNPFANVETASEDSIVEKDFVGGGGTIPTNLYDGVIKAAYIQESQSTGSKAKMVNFIVVIDGKEVRQRITVNNREGKVTYKDKNSGKLKNLPGFSQVNSVCMLIAGKELQNMDVESKTLNLYDHSAGKEVPQSVPCLVELHGEAVGVAIQEQIVDKQKRQDDGTYENTGETRKENEIVKFFAPDTFVTLSEVENMISGMGGDFKEVLNDGDLLKGVGRMTREQGLWADNWRDSFAGKEPLDKSTGAKAGSGKDFGSKAKSGGGDGAKAKTNLFDD